MHADPDASRSPPITLPTLVLALLSGCQSPASDPPAQPQDASSQLDAPSDAPSVEPPKDAAELVSDAVPDAPPDAPPDAMLVEPPPTASPLPDLTLRYGEMATSIRVTTETFAADTCALDECLSASGERRLVRFDTIVVNVGTADLVLGAPDPDTTSWEYDSCHMHYHYVDFANYELLDIDDNVVALGHKQSFCLRDDRRLVGSQASNGYDCTRQGLSIGWADIYDASLDCQFVDVTGLASGTYRLRVVLNQQRTIVESRYDNDVALFTVIIP